jgi:predicted small secreted protein
MKRIIFFLIISICFTYSCNNTETGTGKKDSASISQTDDTTNAISDTNINIIKNSPPLTSGIPAQGDTEIDITFYELPDNMAVKMKNWRNNCPPGSRKDPTRITEIAGVKQAIKDKNPGCTFETIQARFKDKDDEDLYCKINKFENKPEYCRVKNFKFWIYRVTCPGYSETYYAFTTICPPPEDPPCN